MRKSETEEDGGTVRRKEFTEFKGAGGTLDVHCIRGALEVLQSLSSFMQPFL